MTRDEEIAAKLDAMDVRGSDDGDAAWAQLRPLGVGVVPHLRAAYPRFRTWQGRCALAYYATRYARISEDAFQLGLTAITDKSYMVRYRACGVLAYSLRKNALPVLEAAASDEKPLVASSALAARNAILAQNHHLFADWSLSGRTTWSVNDGDHQPGEPAPPLPSRITRMRLGIRPVPPVE